MTNSRAVFVCVGLALTVASPRNATAQQPTYRAATEAPADPAVATLSGAAMLAIPGLHDDFEIAGGGQFVELPNGEARLTGRVRSRGSLFSAFLIDLRFTQRILPGTANHPPAGSPSQQLQPSAYVPNGPVDPATFVYYAQVDGHLYGTNGYDGAIVDVQLTSAAAQLGIGANDRNAELGLLAELTLTVAQLPAGPFGPVSTATLTCNLPASRLDTATHPRLDPSRSPLPFGRALAVAGVADDYVFVPAGEFDERADGTAELRGRLTRTAALDDVWDLTLALSSRVDPGMVNHPPAGSPVLGLLPSAYVGSGGVIDPTGWRYYESATGTLTGDGINAGGQLDLSQNGALQIGGGANQTDAFHGGAGTFTITLVQQPAGRTLTPTGTAELTFLAARSPVLPYPLLTTPQTPYTLPTLTDQGFLLEGDNLAWVEQVAVGTDILGLGDEDDWISGWFRVVDNQFLEVHPRPGRAPGVLPMRALNPAVASGPQQLTLTEPTSPTLIAGPTAPPGAMINLHVHDGQAPSTVVSVVATSFSPLPTPIPGFVSLGIGNGGTRLSIIPSLVPNDPVTGIARLDIGPIPPGFQGFDMLFQAVTVDLNTFVTPLPVTGVWSVAL